MEGQWTEEMRMPHHHVLRVLAYLHAMQHHRVLLGPWHVYVPVYICSTGLATYTVVGSAQNW